MRSTFKVLYYVKKGSEKPNGNLPLMCRLSKRFEQFEKLVSVRTISPPKSGDSILSKQGSCL